jgi:hypothetical protein
MKELGKDIYERNKLWVEEKTKKIQEIRNN